MKKTLSILFALLLLLAPVLCVPAEEITLPVHVQGSIFGGSGKDSIPLEVRFDPAWMSEGDGTAYNEDLAAFCAILSEDIYYRPKDLDRGTPNRVLIDGADPDAYDQTVLLSTLGWEDVRYIESVKAGTYEKDQNDSVTLVLGYCNDRDLNDSFVIVVRGCFSAGEWYSIFDPGSEAEGYEKLTGSHPEWTDTRLLKGIGIAANRAQTFIDAYIGAHDDPARENRVLVTGHSRGGAVAEVLGARFEEDLSVTCRTYTFNATPVTTDADAPAYGTVFNIFDSADFFSDCLPFGNETFYRYGRTLSLPVAGNRELLNTIAAIKGADDYRCLSEDAAETYRTLFARLFPNRASLYAPRVAEYSFESKAEAEAARENFLTLISAETGFGLDAFCFVSDITADTAGKTVFYMTYSRAGELECIGRTLAYGQSASDAVHMLFAQDEDICTVADFIMANAADITGGHRLLNSYALIGYVHA